MTCTVQKEKEERGREYRKRRGREESARGNRERERVAHITNNYVLVSL